MLDHRTGVSVMLRVILTLAIAPGVMASSGTQQHSVRPDGVSVVTGAQWVSPPVTPDFKSVDMRTLPSVRPWKPGDPLVEIPRQFYGDPNTPVPRPVFPTFGEDPLVALQQAYDRARAPSPTAFTTPVQTFEGVRSTASPNDPTGDVGTLQFVMAINGAGGSQVGVYDKATGAQVGSAFAMSSLGSGGLCASSGAGDPIILFDELASRWVLTEFTGSGNLLCVYISSGDDLSGPVTWTRYSFQFPSFPDYPKYGVWPDAYYVGANENGNPGSRPFYAMDRVRMLAGQSATMQRLTIPNLAGFGFQMTQPADIAGNLAPEAGQPGIFMRHRDDEAHNAGSNNPNADFLELFEFTVDWATPANSAIAGPITFQIPEFSSNLNGLSAFEAFPQPNGQRLDPLRETVMHRLVYRRFDGYEALVGNFVTDLFLGAGSVYPDDTGAIRWFELRRATGPTDTLFANGFEAGTRGPAPSWALHQTGTFAPEDTPNVPAEQADRWMGGISIDEAGNIGLAYNVVRQSPAIAASLRYTGRLASDPLGVMTQGETVVVTGSGETGSGSAARRWGDYNDMGVDPVDGCTFWFVGNYANNVLNPSNSRANHVVAFRHDACGTPSFTLSANPLSVGVCANSGSTSNATPIAVNVGQVSGFNNPVNLSFAGLPTGISATVLPGQVTPPGVTQVTLGANNSATAGANVITLQGVSGAINRTLDLTLNVSTDLPAGPTLQSPAAGATGVSATPTLTWQSIPGTSGYTVEIATDAGFANIVRTSNTSGTSYTVAPALDTQTVYHWRVRATNTCGSTNSEVRSFTTQGLPGDCPIGGTFTDVLSEDFEGAATGWVQQAGGVGTNTWAITQDFPFAGARALRGVPASTGSDQRFVSPSIALPSVGNGLTLSFMSRQSMESRSGGGCWDGGFIEVSTNGGSSWTQITSGLLTDPYDGALNGAANPAVGLQAWCGDPQAYLKSVIDLAPYAGQTVQFRFRVASDGSIARAEGWNIDNVLVRRCN
jgi:hypothetical protein